MTVELLKVELTIVAIERAADGTVARERVLGRAPVYPSDLEEIPRAVRDLVDRANDPEGAPS